MVSSIARAALFIDSRSCCSLSRRSFARQPHALPEFSEARLEGKKVLVLGGTGRVGSSAAEALLVEGNGAKVMVASRSEDTYKSSVSRRPSLKQADFIKLDCTDRAALRVG